MRTFFKEKDRKEGLKKWFPTNIFQIPTEIILMNKITSLSLNLEQLCKFAINLACL